MQTREQINSRIHTTVPPELADLTTKHNSGIPYLRLHSTVSLLFNKTYYDNELTYNAGERVRGRLRPRFGISMKIRRVTHSDFS